MRRVIVCATFVGIVSAPAAASADGYSGGVVRIGVINDGSGPLADPMGPGSVVAAKLAIADFEKRHPGIKVDLVYADHQNKADIGSAIVRKWFDVDGVDAIADVGNSAVGLAVQNLVREKNRIAIYTAVATTEITGKQCAPTGFAWQHDSYTLVAGPVRSLVAQKQDMWFFVAPDYAFGKNMVAESQRVLASIGGKSLGVVYHPMSNTDYSSYLLQAQSSGAKVVAFASVGDQIINAMKQWKEFGMDRGTQRPVSQLLFITDVHSMGLDTASGLTSVTAWYWGLNEKTKAFGHRFFALHNRMPTASQAAVYSGISHYLKGVAATRGDNTDKVAKWMRENPVDDFYAPGAKIRQDGKLIHDFILFEVKKKSDVKEPWDYYNILRSVPAGESFAPLSESQCPLVGKG